MARNTFGPTRKIIERRKKVMRLRFVKRWPIEQIATALQVSESTIVRDIKAIIEHNNIEARNELKEPVERTLWEARINYYERQMLRWQEYANTDNPIVRNRILRDIQNDEEQYLKLLQSLGVVERKPDETLVTNESWEDRVKRLRREREEALRAASAAASDDDADDEEEE
jgi:DNA-binding transcriptional MocR family regulator